MIRFCKVHPRRGRRAAAGLLAATMLAGCEGASQDNQMRGLLSVGGCALGAAIGALAGGSQAAAIGCAAGGGTGFVAAEAVNARHRSYSNAADLLDHEKAIADNNLRQTQRYNEALEQHVGQLERQTRALEMQRQAGVTQVAQLQSTRRDIAETTSAARGRLAAIDQALSESQRQLSTASRAGGADSVSLAELESSIGDLERERDKLRGTISGLDAAGRRI